MFSRRQRLSFPSRQLSKAPRRTKLDRRHRSVELQLEKLEERLPLTVNFLAGPLTVPLSNLPDLPLGINSGTTETAIVVNETDPGEIAISNQSNLVASTNAGGTFGTGVNYNNFLTAPQASGGDPDLAYDSTGRLFWTNLDRDPNNSPPRTVSIAEITIDAAGNASQAAGTNAVQVPFVNTSNYDKQFLVADNDPDGISPFADNLYTVFTDLSGTDQVLFSRSTDNGVTWSNPIPISALAETNAGGSPPVWPSDVSVAPNGDVYVAYHYQSGVTAVAGADGRSNSDGTTGEIFVLRSTDGGVTFGGKSNAFLPGEADINLNVQTAPNPIPNARFWMAGAQQPWVLADPARGGHVYVVTNDDPDDTHGMGDEGDIVFSRSEDDGQTWTTSTISTGSGALQVFPTASIDEFGTIAVAWYDARRGLQNATGDWLLDVFATYSVDGGLTWADDFMVNDPDTPLDPVTAGTSVRFQGAAPAGDETFRIGEYFGIDVFGGTAYVAWNGNTFTGNTATGHQAVLSTFPISGALNVFGTNNDDVITITETPDNPLSIDVMVNGVREYSGLAMALTEITINGLGGNDRFEILPSVTAVVNVNGGDPELGDVGVPPGDILVLDLSGVADATVPMGVTSGAVGSTSHMPVVFTSIETVIASDPLEENDTLATATFLGSESIVTLPDLSIDNAADEDWFRITAHDTGKLVFNIFFADIVGDLDIEVTDSTGSVLASSTSVTDDEQVIIPVVSQERYFLRVFGVGADVNTYDLEIENFPAPVPTGVHLDPASDTGTSDHDNVTADTTPTFFIQTNVLDFVDSDNSGFFVEGTDAITALNPGSDGQFTDPVDELNEDGEEPGIAVEVTLFNTTNPLVPPVIGFAEPVADSFPEVYRFTPTAPLADGVYFVTSRTKVFDDQNPMAMGRSDASEPLWITIDTEAPVMPAPDMLASSDSGMFDNDDVTNVDQPAFTGIAEENAIVHVFAQRVDPATGLPTGDVELVGSGIVGTDNTDLVPGDDMGRWEVTVEPLSDGAYDITTRFEDAAGGLSDPSDALRIVVDTEAPNTPYLDLLDDTGRSDVDNITKDNQPQVYMTTTDPNVELAEVLFTDNLKFRLFDRFEATAEFLIYDSANDVVADNVTTAGDMFTSLTELTRTIPSVIGTLDDGVHNLKLEVEDRAGNISHDFLLSIIVDTVNPPVSFGLPNVVDPEDGLAADSDSGSVIEPATFADRITSDTTPRLWGRAEADTIVRVFLDRDADGIIDLATDTFLGQTVAVPDDGNDAYPEGYWELVSTLDLNEIVGLPRDGLRSLLVTAEDVAGNPMPMNGEIDVVDQLDIFIDTQGPQVDAVTVTDFPDYDLFDPKPSENGFSPLIDSLTIHLEDLPDRLAPDFLYNAFLLGSAEINGHYQVVGDHVGFVDITRVAVLFDAPVDGQPATGTVTLFFAEPLPDDRFTLIVLDEIVDPAGNRLDGESDTVEPTDDPNIGILGDNILSGNGVPGGNFVARFTVDSRPEIGSYVSQNIDIDINGNFVWDPANDQIGNDATNVDLTFTLGVANADGSVGLGRFGTHDLAFAGQFTAPGQINGVPRLFDQLAAYGWSSELGQRRWLVDTDSDGVVTLGTDVLTIQPDIAGFNVAGAIPVAGNFDGNAANGDEIGLYYAGQWALDTDRDFIIQPAEVTVNNNLLGHPIVGDFDGDGLDDLAVFNNNVFTFDLAFNGFNGQDDTLVWGFPGVLDRPIAADMNQDGIDDIGLWVPRNSAQDNRIVAEWYFLISDIPTNVIPVAGSINWLDHPFEPVPFGTDIYAEFGDELALPIVGNFDPPVVAEDSSIDPNTNDDGDFDQDGDVDGADFLAWQRNVNTASGSSAAASSTSGSMDSAALQAWESTFGEGLPLPADFDGSGAVDGGDLSTWGVSYGTAPPVGSMGDANHDGRVNGADFFAWQRSLQPAASPVAAMSLSSDAWLSLEQEEASSSKAAAFVDYETAELPAADGAELATALVTVFEQEALEGMASDEHGETAEDLALGDQEWEFAPLL